MAKEAPVKPGWKSLPIGDVLEAGTAHNFKTGDWRSSRPVHNAGKCINCLICWIYCPDSSILTEGGKWKAFDLDHCKGCGICAAVCPPKVTAITMVDEREARKEGK
jgi:2-oxoacid:acceptor oxidoreductase delta subunit (pyruvate/2-ketoisovalerate family)